MSIRATGSQSAVVTATGPDLGALFVALLNAVLARQDIDRQFFRSFTLDSLEQTDTAWLASGTLVGEPIDLVRHSLGNEVKAATYSGLRVVECPSQTILRCVLDI